MAGSRLSRAATQPRYAVALDRVSTAEQGRSGLGLEAQQTSVRGFAEREGWTLVAEHQDIASGKDDRRPGFQAALTRCRQLGAVLVAACLDRITRRAHTLSQLLEEAAHKGRVYPGEHLPIIDRALWDKVHALLKESPHTRGNANRHQTPALLKGLLFGTDGRALSPSHTCKRGRLYRYYVSQAALKGAEDTDPTLVRRISAAEIEGAVVGQVRALLRQPEIVVGAWAAARATDPGLTEGETRDALYQLEPLWDELFPAEQARIVGLLVERVTVSSTGADIRLRFEGLASLVRDLGASRTPVLEAAE
ncbi:recombinase family protein [Pararoseomonas sp. SCSIO 73927]|uniref:recombinase family protein n=1 Tax=Pararoseomonas sp. SCSIO 73927 TaxID=3114537 RepID=UPI0030D50756